MSNVVQLRLPAQELEPATFANAWAMLPDTMKRRSDSKARCEALWNREAKRLSGQEDLLARLRTYLRDDRDLPKSGGPGLQVLLRQGRLEHWVAMQQDVRTVEPFPMAELRAQVAAQKGEAFCRSYLDRCQVDGTSLLVGTHYAMDKLIELRALFKSHGLTGMRHARDVERGRSGSAR